MFNASYLRLKNLSLAYTLPKAMTRKAFIENARLFFTASNLWTIAKYKEADPEVSEYGTRVGKPLSEKRLSLALN